MKLIILFTALTVFNVIIQTVKSLCTVRCSTFTSACVNALAYGLYTYVIFFTTSEGMPLWSKAVITAVANFFGVYVANYIFDKFFSKTRLDTEKTVEQARRSLEKFGSAGLEKFNKWCELFL